MIMTMGSQRCRAALLLLIVTVVAVTGSSADAANTVLKFDIYLVGDFYVRLLDQDAPITVDNFMTYVNWGDYNDSFFHRLVPGFVLQGGSYTYDGFSAVPLVEDPPIVNEFGHSNVRGTLAMAKLPPPSEEPPPNGDPDSATNGFFFNLSDDNAANLDIENGGSTVFAYVIGDGMDIVDELAARPPNPWAVEIFDWGKRPPMGWGEAFGALPLIPQPDGWYFEWLNYIIVVGTDGDVDFDWDVDDDDYNAFTASFGQSGLGLAADFDGDEDVDLADFAVLRGNYTGPAGSPLPDPGTAVPEPGGICLLGLCGMALIRKRRRKS